MDQSHPPLWTAAPHPALAHQQTHLQKQADNQIKSSDCPTGPQRKQERATKMSLMSTAKFANAGCTTIFDGDQVNIYDQHDTVIMVSCAAIIWGWREPGTNELFWIPLVPVVCNNNTKTILVKQPPNEYLLARPPPQDDVFNVYGTSAIPPRLRRFFNKADVAPCSQE